MKISKEYVNLLPRQEKQARSGMGRGLIPVALFALGWLGAFGWQMNDARVLRDRLSSLEANKKALQAQTGALQKELGITSNPSGLDKAALINSIMNERVLWSQVFKQFAQTVPKGLWFDGLEGTTVGQGEIRIRGGAFNYHPVAQFMLAMEKSGYFLNPQLTYARNVVVQGQDVVGFEIVCGIKKEQGSR
jgi:Tfp pilus assembly protein PilN